MSESGLSRAKAELRSAMMHQHVEDAVCSQCGNHATPVGYEDIEGARFPAAQARLAMECDKCHRHWFGDATRAEWLGPTSPLLVR